MKVLRQAFGRAAFAALLAGGVASGCVSPRPTAKPVAPPSGYQGAALAARHGFHAVYEGELRIWFHSFRAIWYIAAAPDSDRLAVAVLSPTGVKIMQMHGDSSGRECEVSLSVAARLRPYGEALWDGLWWSLAAGDPAAGVPWVLRRNRMIGSAAMGPVQARVQAEANSGTLERIDLRRKGRRWVSIRLADFREDAGRAYPAWIRVDSVRPRSRLVLTLKSMAWTSVPEGEPHDAGP